ncbi:MAG: glycosyltransferase family 4 protein [Nitrospinaceae bacterium]
MKIVHVISTLNTGGAEMMLLKLVGGRIDPGIEHAVVSLTGLGALGPRFEALGIPVYHLDMTPGLPHPGPVWKLWSILRQEKPDVVQTWLYYADVLGALCAKLSGAPHLVWNLRCANMDMRYFPRMTGLARQLLAFFSGMPDAVLVNSQAGKKVHESLGFRPRRWVRIPNGFDLDRFRLDPQARQQWRTEWNLPESSPLIGIVGRYDPMKDFKTFVSAAGRLLHMRTEVHFLLVGRGVDSANRELAGWIQDTGQPERFHCLGERQDIPQLLSALDLFTSSSSGEGFPNAVGEAMACQLPCVVTDAGDSKLLVDCTGRAVPPGQPEMLARAWQEMLEKGTAALQELGRAARERIQSHYELSAVIRQYETFYRDLVSRTPGD